jgi:hypothetical protein
MKIMSHGKFCVLHLSVKEKYFPERAGKALLLLI